MSFHFAFLHRVRGGFRVFRTGAMVGLAALALVAVAGNLAAQQMPGGISADQLQELQQMRGGSGSTTTTTQAVTPRETILEPQGPTNPNLPTTRLEEILSQRAGTKLHLIGYDQLGIGRPVSLPQVGAIQDNYILGPGDEIVVSLRGQENAEYRAVIDRDGRVVLPRLSPVSAAGRSFGDFRQDLLNAIHRAYVSTEGYISVGRLRQISVLVSGEVGSPGVRTLTGLSTAVDAILVSGGVKKTGSLRNIRVIRGGREIPVDLYGVLTGQARASSVALTDGDRIVVPALGRTVAVVGWVRRPGIYELAGGRAAISTRELIALAGGLEVRGKYRMSLMRVAADGRNQMVPLAGEQGAVSDSDILFVLPAVSETSQTATLSGGTHLAGQYAANSKLSEILKSPGAMGRDPYTLFGIISRRDPVTLLRVLIPFTPVAVLKGAQDLKMQGDDIVRVIQAPEARALFTAVQQYRVRAAADQDALINPNAAPTVGVSGGPVIGSAEALSSAVTRGSHDGANLAQRQAAMALGAQGQSGQSPAMPNAQGGALGPSEQYGAVPNSQYPYQGQNQYQNQNPYPQLYDSGVGQQSRFGTQTDMQSGSTENLRITDVARSLQVDPLVLINFLNDRAVHVDGAVQGPGLYLVGPDADIQSLVAAAGGFSRWADRSTVEVISTSVDPAAGKSRTERRTLSLMDNADAGYVVSPQDEVRVNQVFTAVGVGSVTVQGQIRHAGTYQIVRGEHLSDLLMRAGGLTDTAYPYGTIFLRKSAAQREQEAFQREAQEIENQLLLAMSRRDPNSKLSPEAFQAMQTYVAQIRTQKPLGRVTVAADPVVLASNPAGDPLLEPGDVVYIPPRPYSVAVLGEVLQPGNIPFRNDMSASDYIDNAGGYSQFADKSETILVLPDGSARRVEHSWLDLNMDSNTVPPGSTIFVARDISGIDLHQIIVDTTQIMSQLAISAASLAVLSKQ